jgi:hypothetical protein
MSSTKTQSAPESRIGLNSNSLYLPNGYSSQTGNRYMSLETDKSTEATTGLGSDETDLGQGIGYLDYDNVGLTGLGVRRRLALQRALRRRNGAAEAGGGAAAAAAGSDSGSALSDLNAAGGGLGLTGLNNRGQGLLGLGSSGYGGGHSDGGYEPTSVVSGYGYGPSQQCKTGLNPLLVLLTLAAAAAGFYFIYTKLTSIAGRKKREAGDSFDLDWLADVVFTGGSSTFVDRFQNCLVSRVDCHQVTS